MKTCNGPSIIEDMFVTVALVFSSMNVLGTDASMYKILPIGRLSIEGLYQQRKVELEYSNPCFEHGFLGLLQQSNSRATPAITDDVLKILITITCK